MHHGLHILENSSLTAVYRPESYWRLYKSYRWQSSETEYGNLYKCINVCGWVLFTEQIFADEFNI